MKKYKVRFWIKGHEMTTTIETTSEHEARELIKAQYPEAKSISISKIG